MCRRVRASTLETLDSLETPESPAFHYSNCCHWCMPLDMCARDGGRLLSECSGQFVIGQRLAQKPEAPVGRIERMASSPFQPSIDLLTNYCLDSFILTR